MVEGVRGRDDVSSHERVRTVRFGVWSGVRSPGRFSQVALPNTPGRPPPRSGRSGGSATLTDTRGTSDELQRCTHRTGGRGRAAGPGPVTSLTRTRPAGARPAPDTGRSG
ncbi:Uncharacterised protein [Mycobacteroides abscessus]|nr:Uncharacterised protein [Mycobacteroides abscessus]